MKNITFLTLLVALTTSISASAQEVLTLQDAVKKGLESNYNVRLAGNDLKTATNNNTYGNAGFFPKVDATIGGNLKSSSDETTALNGTKTSNSPQTVNASAGLSLSWTLFDGMNMFISKEKLDLLQQVGETALRINMENTTAQIIMSYNSIVQQKKLIKVFTEALNISLQRASIARKAKSIGAGSEVAMLKSEVDYKTDSANLIQQKLALSNLKADLNELLGRNPQQDFDVSDISLAPESINLSDIMTKGLEQNPSLIATRQQQTVSELDVKSAKSSQLPSINLNSSYTFNQYDYKNGSYDKMNSHGPFVGVTAGVTLFNGFKVRRNIRNAQIQLENAQVRTEQMEQALRTDIIKGYNAFTTNTALVDIEQKSLALAQRNLDIAIKAYAQGSISDLEMRETQKNFVDVSYRLINAQINLKNTEVELRRISGTLTVKN